MARTKPTSLTKLLDDARAAVERDDHAAALGVLLVAYSAVPAAELADAIERVGQRARVGLVAPTGKTPPERQKAWLAAARKHDPAMRGVLLESLADNKGWVETLARIRLLAKAGDPRVAAKLCDIVETPIYNASVARTKEFWVAVFGLLAKLGDPRVGERQRGFAAAWDASTTLNPPEPPVLKRRLAAVVPAIERAYGEGPPVLEVGDAARCAAIVAAIRAPATTSKRADSDLLGEIYARPDDDQVRMVYADWLQERDDPHGELIALQLARARGIEPSKQQSKRERDLLAEYAMRWLGPLATMVKKTSIELERGFLAVCEPTAAIDTNPAWATVRELVRAVPASDDCRMAGLRSLVRLDNDHIGALAQLERELAVETLDWNGPAYWASAMRDTVYDGYRKAIARFRKIRVLPKLRRLVLDGPWIENPIKPAALDWAWRSPACSKLEELAFPSPLKSLGTWIKALDATGLRRVEVVNEHTASWAWRAIVERDAAGRLSCLTLRGPSVLPRWRPSEAADDAVAGMAALPAKLLTSVRVAIPPGPWTALARHRTQLAAALAKQTRLAGDVEIAKATR